MTVGLGIVGLASYYSHYYANQAAAAGDVEVVALVPGERTDEQLAKVGRPSASEFATEYDCTIHDDLDGLVADEAVDAAVVSSLSTRRADDAVTVLESGRPVLTGKPAAATAEGADRIAAAAERADVPAVTTTPHRFDEAVQSVHERIADGVIGDVLRAKTAVYHAKPGREGIKYGDGHAPEQVGTTYTMGFYTTDALLWMVDDTPERVSGELANTNTPYQEHPDLGSATVRFEDGAIGTMTITMANDHGPRYGWDVEVVGTDGMLRSHHTGHEGILWSGENRRTAEVFGRTLDPVLDKTFRAFLDSVVDEAGPHAVAPSGDSVGDAIALCTAWENAAESGGVATYDR